MYLLDILGGLDAILHVIFAIVAIIMIYSSWKEKFLQILLFAILMEVIIDGAHIVNKSITHNIFFLIEVPLFILFAGYVFGDKRIESFSMLLLANNLTHFMMDMFYEGDAIQLYYPLTTTYYSVPPEYVGFLPGTLSWLLFIIPMAIVMHGMLRKPTQPVFPPPYPIGR